MAWGRGVGGQEGGPGREDCAHTCIIAVPAAATRGLQCLQEGLQRDMDQGLPDAISGSAVWSCHHGCCCLWGPGQVPCWRRGGGGGKRIRLSGYSGTSTPSNLALPLPRPAPPPPTIRQQLTAAGGHSAGQAASPGAGQLSVFLTVPAKAGRHNRVPPWDSDPKHGLLAEPPMMADSPHGQQQPSPAHLSPSASTSLRLKPSACSVATRDMPGP